MDLNLTNKLALVTGSTAGIGNAIATVLASEGAELIVNGRSPASVNGAVVTICLWSRPYAKEELW